MRFLANENFPLRSILYLRGLGFDVSSVGIDHKSVEDVKVLQIAIAESRTILTFDKDYGELIYKYHSKPPQGIIYLRLEGFGPEDPGKLIAELVQLKKVNFEKALTVIDKNGIRQRKY